MAAALGKIIIARSNDEVCGDHAVGHRPVQPASVGGGDAAAGQAKAAACAACHGAQGKVTVPMYPNLAGQNAMYLQHALQAYKGAQRRPSRGDEGLCVGAVG